MTKKILAVLLALAMVLSLVSVNVFAAANETAETEEIYTYTWKDYDSNWHNISKKWHAEEFEKLLAALETEGSVVTATYTGSVGWGIQIGFKNGDENITEATTTAVHDATAKTCTVSGADLLAIVEKNAPDLSAVADCEFYINTGSEKDVHDMTISVTAPKASEGEGDTGDTGDDADLEVVWELAAPVGEIGSKTTSDLFGAQHAAFLEAINTEGAVFEITVTNPSENGMMTNIFADGSWDNAYVAAGKDKWPSNGTFTYKIPAADLMEKAGITEITNMRLQFGIYGDDTVKISLDSAKVLVPKSGDEGDEKEEFQVLFEETFAGYKGEWTTILLQEKADDFIKACSAEDATVMIIIDDVDYTFNWAQFILQNEEHGSGLTVDGGSYEGDVFTIPGVAVVDAWNENDISNSSWYQICFNSNPLADQGLEPADMYICVLAPVSSGGEGDEDGTTVKLKKATWDGGKQGNFQINIPLDDVNAVKDPSTIESFVVELTVTGAVADGEKIDVTKIGSDVAIMDPWTAAGLYISPEADGTLKLEVPAAKIGTSNNWIIQLYIDGENLPSGLDTKEASLTYKDFKITINYKPEPKKCDHEDDYDATEVKGTVDTEKTTFTPDEELTDATLVHIEFEEPAAADGTVTVNYAEVKEPVQKPEGTEYALEKNGTYNWAYTYMWETLATVLKDIDPNEALKYDDVEITLEISGAIADGELIDASKVHGNLVVQPKWSGWISIADTVADANGVINIKADLTQFKNETTDATSQVISQLYIDPADLPNGLDGTKEATIYVKSATIRIGADTYSTKPTTTPSEPTKPEYEEVTGYTAAEFAKDHQDADGVITFNDAWSDCPGFWWGDTSTFGGYDSVEIVVEAVSNYTQYRLVYVDDENVEGNFSAPSTITIDIDPTKMIKQLYVQSSAAGSTVKISSIKWRKAAAATPATVAVSEGVPVGASVPAPETATFKAGDPCVTVEVDPDLVIESITIEGATIAKVEVLTKKATKPTNPAIPGLPNVPGLGFGYPIQLGNEYHGFLLADGSMITMPHEFNANGFCTVCGYTVLNNSTPATDVTVDVPTEAPETQEDDTEGDDMNVSDEVETPKEDENPKTGLALAVLPMLAAAAVAAASRKH